MPVDSVCCKVCFTCIGHKYTGICRLDYDGEEDAMFRWTACTMFAREIFEQFDMVKLALRFFPGLCVETEVLYII